MVLIAVNNFQDEDSLGLYEFPEGSLIIDLKAEIEATEGIPVGHQRLVRKHGDKQDLKENEILDSLLISDGASKAIIYLVKAQVSYHLERRDTNEYNKIPNPRSEKHHKEVIDVVVNLDEPVHISLSWCYMYNILDPSATNIYVLGSDGQPTIIISDINRSLSYYGVCNDDTLHIAYVPWNTTDTKHLLYVPEEPCEPLDSEYYSEYYEEGEEDEDYDLEYTSKGIIVRAKYDWNGEMMHPNIKGLSLKNTALFAVSNMSKYRGFKHSPGWLYGSPISPLEINSSLLSRFSGARTVEGYFPEIFVSPVNGPIAQNLEVTSTEILDIPPLPPFHFPPAHRMTFRMPIGDKGHSFVKFTANYECISSPVDPTHVTISLLCTTHDVRRISAVSVFITIPESALQDVQVCENEVHQVEIHTDKEVTETKLKGKYFDGINIGTPGTTVGFQGGVSRNYSLGETEKGQKVSRRKITAGIDKEDTVFWNLKAPTSKLDEDGLDGEESITLVLKKKPVEFKYKCRVTHARDRVEKTTQRITDNKPWEFFRSR